MKSIEEYKRLNDEAAQRARELKPARKPSVNWKKKYQTLLEAVRGYYREKNAPGEPGLEYAPSARYIQANEHLWRLTHDES